MNQMTVSKNKAKIQLALVDDHNLFRKGLEKLVNMRNESDMYSILFEAENGKALQEKIKSTGVPEIIFMDIDMPDMDGFETVRWLKHNHQIKIIVVSMFDSEEAVLRMIRLGVDGYLSKDLEVDDVHDALEEVAKGGKYYPPFVATIMAENIENINSSGTIKVGPLAGISERERAFLEYVPTDLTYEQIADKMNLSQKTIDGYRNTLFVKFKVKSRQGLTAYLLRNKIIR